jgi:hypothetical protein
MKPDFACAIYFEQPSGALGKTALGCASGRVQGLL